MRLAKILSDRRVDLVTFGVACIAAVSSLVVIVVMALSYFNLSAENPLYNPEVDTVLAALDADPSNADLAETYRDLDLMARRAYFAGRGQIDAGRILLAALLVILFFMLQVRTLMYLPEKMKAKAEREQRASTAIEGSGDAAPPIGKETISSQTGGAASPLPSPGLSFLRSRSSLIAAWSFAGALVVSGIVLGVATDRVLNAPVAANAEAVAAVAESFPSLADGTQGNWSSFRNGGAPAMADETRPVEWDAATGQGIVWSVPLDKPGFSSPVVWNDSVYLTSADATEFVVECRALDDGRELWRYVIPVADPAALPEVNAETGWAAPTPAADADGVYAMFATGTLIALTHDGGLKWSQELGAPVNRFGHSSSLLVYAGLVLLQYDSDEGSYVAGIDTEDGVHAWHTARDPGKSSASPILAEFEGAVYLILAADPKVTAYNPLSGEPLWETECLSGDIGPSPAYADGVVYAAQAYAALTALSVETGEILWRQSDAPLPDACSPAAGNGRVYLGASFGIFSCFDAATGDILWYEERTTGFYSSPLVVGDRVYLTDRAGVTFVFSTAGSYAALGQGSLGEAADATPALIPGGLLVRSAGHLWRIGSR